MHPGDPFDPEWCRSLSRDALGPMVDDWFRPLIIDGDKLPVDGPAIIAANHSGNALPYDAIALDLALWKREGMPDDEKIRSVFEPALAQVWWLCPFGIENFWRRGGGVDMTFHNFGELLERGDRVLYYPEGVPGIGKGFQNRYRLQPFHTSFVLHAWSHRLPVYPLYVINAEFVMPLHFTLAPLDWVVQRVGGVPFLPLPAGIAALIFPWLWFLAFPARMVFVAGDPIDVQAMLRAEGVAEDEVPTREQTCTVAERIRGQMQAELTHQEQLHGRSFYDWRGLWHRLRAMGTRWWRAVPLFWPISFLVHERDRLRPKARNRLHAILRDFDLAAFYLPLGWPLLSLARAWRKPPYGYRGLTLLERRRREGAYLWQLSEHPLPPKPERGVPPWRAPHEPAEATSVVSS